MHALFLGVCDPAAPGTASVYPSTADDGDGEMHPRLAAAGEIGRAAKSGYAHVDRDERDAVLALHLGEGRLDQRLGSGFLFAVRLALVIEAHRGGLRPYPQALGAGAARARVMLIGQQRHRGFLPRLSAEGGGPEDKELYPRHPVGISYLAFGQGNRAHRCFQVCRDLMRHRLLLVDEALDHLAGVAVCGIIAILRLQTASVADRLYIHNRYPSNPYHESDQRYKEYNKGFSGRHASLEALHLLFKSGRAKLMILRPPASYGEVRTEYSEKPK